MSKFDVGETEGRRHRHNIKEMESFGYLGGRGYLGVLILIGIKNVFNIGGQVHVFPKQIIDSRGGNKTIKYSLSQSFYTKYCNFKHMKENYKNILLFKNDVIYLLGD